MGLYIFRCRVRIVGYHGNEMIYQIKISISTYSFTIKRFNDCGGCGRTMQYQGGEVVVGFFFDGDDGQQPVIFGTLFKQSFVEDQLKNQ